MIRDLKYLIAQVNLPGKDWSWVNLYLGKTSPNSFIVVCLWQPKGARDGFGSWCRMLMGRGRANPLSTSSSITGSMWAACFSKDGWFPLSWWKERSKCRVSSLIGCNGKEAPFSSKSFNLGQKGWSRSTSSSSSIPLNSEPYDIWLGCWALMILSKSKLCFSRIWALW